MSLTSVKEYFKQYNLQHNILEFSQLSATVEQAAEAINVIPARIAKTLSFKQGDSAILVVTAGDTKIDNKKFRNEFGMKARMLVPEEVVHFTGHKVGGVCPFGLKNNLAVFLDISMKRFATLFPACGSNNSAIELTCEELFLYANAIKWVDVCNNWE